MQSQSDDSRAGSAMGSDSKVPPNTFGWTFVSLQLASEWLARRKHNRVIRKADVTFMARQMREGLWRKNPQPLLFEASSGRLIDGQHRLSAMVEAGIPMWFRVDCVEDDVMPVLDTGRSRTAADVIALYDEELQGGSYTACAAAIKLLLAWERNRNPFVGQTGGSNRISNLEVRDALSRFPTLHRNVQRASQLMSAGIPGGTGSWAALLTKFESIDSDLCDDFFEGMLTGAELKPGSPILAVRNRLRASRATRYALPRVEMATIVIRGWNAFVRGRTLTIVRGRVRAEPLGRPTDASFPLVETPSLQVQETAVA